jgi:site-specific DNA-methyltransferase (adenine-specific)
LAAGGLERRGEVVRLVRTLRGGERPKNAHEEFPGVSVIPRATWEPWEIFRAPLEGRIRDNLRKWGTGGLRRTPDRPFVDVIASGQPSPDERRVAPHPSLKPQAFLRQVVWAALPLGRGVVLDPFMGSGSTIAAAEAVGYRSVGVELNAEYFALATTAVRPLSLLKHDSNGSGFGRSGRQSDRSGNGLVLGGEKGARIPPGSRRGERPRAAMQALSACSAELQTD